MFSGSSFVALGLPGGGLSGPSAGENFPQAQKIQRPHLDSALPLLSFHRVFTMLAT